jgi:CHAD domain-containing protein
MQPLELALSLHRALEARSARLDGLLAREAWWLDAEGLHDVRVAIRRMRAVVGLLDPETYPRLKAAGRALKAFTGLLGERRELDVFRALLEGLREQAAFDLQRATAEHLMAALDRRRDKAARRLAEGLGDAEPEAWRRLLAVPSLPSPFQAPPAREAAWDLMRPPLASALEALRDLDRREDVPALHAARVRLKRARYRVEVLAEAFPAPPQAFLARLKALQDALGDHHDMALLETFLWERQAELAAQDLKTLASSLLELVGMAAEGRHRAFGGLLAALAAVEPEAWAGDLRRELAGGSA